MNSNHQNVTLKSDGIYLSEKLFLKIEELPFNSKHFPSKYYGSNRCLFSFKY